MIDIVDALDLLNSCVRDRGENYRSPALDESTASASWRYDAGRAVTDDIVTRALASAATPTTTGSWLMRGSVVDAYASGQNPFNLTLGAVIVLRAAQSTERRGATWGASLEAALRGASRFVELIPGGFGDSTPYAKAASSSRRTRPLKTCATVAACTQSRRTTQP
jgi:hypothetical protein